MSGEKGSPVRHPMRATEPHEAPVAARDSPWLLRPRPLPFARSERRRRVSVPMDPARSDPTAEHREIG